MRQNNHTVLDDCLDAYAAAVETAVEPRSWSARLGNWPVYAAATGAALASGTSAAAGIIHGFANVGFTGITANAAVAPGSAYTHVGFGNSIGNSYINYWAPSLYAWHTNALPSFRRGAVGISSCSCLINFFDDVPVGPGPLMLHRFNSGEMISGGGTPFLVPIGYLAARCEEGTATVPRCGGTPSFDLQPWTEDVYGFAGFRTQTNLYGWIRLKWNSDDGYPTSITALDWAIEDSGLPIQAGDTGVPEPGTLSMAFLAAGAAGILAWRKRRNAAAKA